MVLVVLLSIGCLAASVGSMVWFLHAKGKENKRKVKEKNRQEKLRNSRVVVPSNRLLHHQTFSKGNNDGSAAWLQQNMINTAHANSAVEPAKNKAEACGRSEEQSSRSDSYDSYSGGTGYSFSSDSSSSSSSSSSDSGGGGCD